MRKIRIRDGFEKHEPYPLNEFPESVIQGVGKHVVQLKATGHNDMSGNMFSDIYAKSIEGESHLKPLGVADVSWSKCCWSVKTVKSKNPHTTRKIRLISGRNSPLYSAGISDPLVDVQRTGTAVLDIYNSRIAKARSDHDDVRLLVLVRNMESLLFTIFERAITPFATNNYRWEMNQRNNLLGFEDNNHCFTWQPYGAQFTVHETVPGGATKFKIEESVPVLELQHVLSLIDFKPEWIKTV